MPDAATRCRRPGSCQCASAARHVKPQQAQQAQQAGRDQQRRWSAVGLNPRVRWFDAQSSWVRQ